MLCFYRCFRLRVNYFVIWRNPCFHMKILISLYLERRFDNFHYKHYSSAFVVPTVHVDRAIEFGYRCHENCAQSRYIHYFSRYSVISSFPLPQVSSCRNRPFRIHVISFLIHSFTSFHVYIINV